MGGFYKYIVKSKNSYRIIKDNVDYGSFSRLTDALYERDRLIKCNWDWEASLELEETENLYEKMSRLPPFIHEYSYIHEVSQSYQVHKGREYCGTFNNKADAYAYARMIGGRVIPTHKRYRIQKSIDGKSRYFGQFKTLEEAQEVRDRLIENGWKE